MTKIVREGSEDLTIKVRRFGRLVVVSTERPGVARSVERAIVSGLVPKSEGQSAIGFTIDRED